jgi:hypothetical protein
MILLTVVLPSVADEFLMEGLADDLPDKDHDL